MTPPPSLHLHHPIQRNCTIRTLCWWCMVVTALFSSWQVIALFALFTPTISHGNLFNCVATDATKRKFGGAGATCLETHDVYEALYLSSPNHTVLHTQGLWSIAMTPSSRHFWTRVMQNGTSVDAILEEKQRLDNNNFTSRWSMDILRIWKCRGS